MSHSLVWYAVPTEAILPGAHRVQDAQQYIFPAVPIGWNNTSSSCTMSYLTPAGNIAAMPDSSTKDDATSWQASAANEDSISCILRLLGCSSHQSKSPDSADSAAVDPFDDDELEGPAPQPLGCPPHAPARRLPAVTLIPTTELNSYSCLLSANHA